MLNTVKMAYLCEDKNIVEFQRSHWSTLHKLQYKVGKSPDLLLLLLFACEKSAIYRDVKTALLKTQLTGTVMDILMRIILARSLLSFSLLLLICEKDLARIMLNFWLTTACYVITADNLLFTLTTVSLKWSPSTCQLRFMSFLSFE